MISETEYTGYKVPPYQPVFKKTGRSIDLTQPIPYTDTVLVHNSLLGTPIHNGNSSTQISTDPKPYRLAQVSMMFSAVSVGAVLPVVSFIDHTPVTFCPKHEEKAQGKDSTIHVLSPADKRGNETAAALERFKQVIDEKNAGILDDPNLGWLRFLSLKGERTDYLPSHFLVANVKEELGKSHTSNFLVIPTGRQVITTQPHDWILMRAEEKSAAVLAFNQSDFGKTTTSA